MYCTLGDLRYFAVAVLGSVLLLAPVSVRAQSAREVPVRSVSTSDNSILNDPFARKQGKRGLDLLYNMKFEQAEQAFDRIVRRYPNHPVGPFLKGLNIWWNHIMLDLSDTSHDEEFYAAMDAVIEQCDRILEDDSDNLDALFLKGAALGFRARLHSDREEWLKAVLDGKRAIGYVRKVGKMAPEIPDFVFGKGMYDYYAAIIPEHYPMARAVTFFLPDGNRKRGLQQLREAARDGQYIQTEAIYFLLQINYLYEKDYWQSKRYAEMLRRRHPDNPYFHTYQGRVYARWGQWDKARTVFQSIVDRYQEGKTGYNRSFAEQAVYYLARERMARDAYDEALDELVKLEALVASTDEDSPYKVLGRLRQGMAYDALGKREAAVRRYREVLQMEDHSKAHERAEQYLETPYKG